MLKLKVTHYIFMERKIKINEGRFTVRIAMGR